MYFKGEQNRKLFKVKFIYSEPSLGQEQLEGMKRQGSLEL